MKTMKSVFLLALFAMASSVAAQEAGHLNVQTVVQKEEVSVNESGERQVRLVEASALAPCGS